MILEFASGFCDNLTKGFLTFESATPLISHLAITQDILIIGGGVIGLSIARELRKGGAGRIAVVERGVCGKESSWAAAGMIAPQVEADEGGTFFEVCRHSRIIETAFCSRRSRLR